MKKLIALIIILLLVIVGLLKIAGVDFSLLSSSDKKDSGRKTLTGFLQKPTTYEDMIGGSLPKAATDIHTHVSMRELRYIAVENNWLVARLPKEDFYDLVERLKLNRNRDLLKSWPQAFDCQVDKFKKFWDVTNTINEDTYYVEKPEEEIYIVAKYKSGKLYFKKTRTYAMTLDENGNISYEKITALHVKRTDKYGNVYYDEVEK